ncbi:MAG: MBL fold metallo-hydrolase [Acidobacteriota bacterium]|nr:MBL fold metallo-hydrolase [Acidobacteriota bacterium]
MRTKTLRILLVSLIAAGSAAAQTDDGLYVRIVDAGPGLCTVTRMPGGHYMVYDAGHWEHAEVCIEGIQEVVPAGESIDLMVISHSDADHLAAVPEIFAAYQVDRIVRPGWARWTNKNWREVHWTVKRAREAGKTVDVNLYRLRDQQIQPGFSTDYGDTKVIQVAGFRKPPDSWGSLESGERRNAGSIVIRLDYAGKSVLFTGDAVGRHLTSPEDTCIASEKFMVDNASQVPLRSDVLIAPHHGANNASSPCFIDEVKPSWVVFSAGHDHQHPTRAAAQRYIDSGVAKDHIFRTDRGDYESGPYHWQDGTSGMEDLPRDDDVEVFISPAGEVCVQYRGAGAC